MTTYQVQFEYAAVFVILALLALYAARKKYPAPSNKWFMALMICVLAAAVMHILAIDAVTDPWKRSLVGNYITHSLYMLFYNYVSVAGFVYVVSLMFKKIRKPEKIFAISAAAFFFIAIVTSPFTKLFIYLDEDRNYLHGPLFYALPGLSLATMVYFMVLFFIKRRTLSKFQVALVFAFAGITAISVGIQLLLPYLVVGNFGLSLAMIMFLVSMQNPDTLLDSSTKFYNTQAFYLRTGTLIEKNREFRIAAFSLEGLTYVNEILSINENNAIMNAIAERIKKFFPKCDIFHLNRETFALFISDLRDLSSDDGVGDEEEKTDLGIRLIKDAFAEPVLINDIEVSLTPYICTVRYPDFVQSTEDVRDALQYTLKMAANDTVTEAASDSIEAKKRENRVLAAVRSAVSHNGFKVFYQPIYNTQSKTFESCEALIRLIDTELGFISPEEFIPLAESHGLIIEIGRQVFRNVCRFIKEIEAKEFGLHYIEVNLSVLQCVNEKLADDLISIMEEYNVSPHEINFEITETAGLADYNKLIGNMKTLIDYGVGFSMDDYGTGFSTANYLISLPTELVKIDKSILWAAMEDKQAMAILRHTVEMLRSLGKKIVVEGVETKEMVELLTDMGVEYLQGYYFSKPVNEQDYIEFMGANREK